MLGVGGVCEGIRLGHKELTYDPPRQEKEIIETALEERYGQVSGPSGAATKLGLPARTLDSKIKRFKINKYLFKVPRAS